MQYPMSFDALIHRCDVDESCISPEFIANLSNDRKKLFDSLCPKLRVVVAKLGTQISRMGHGRIVDLMIGTFAVADVHTVLPLVQRTLAVLLGVSRWNLMKAFKKIVKLERWPAAEYCGPATFAAIYDEDLMSARRNGSLHEKEIAAARLNQHLEEYSGLHICGAIIRFSEKGSEIYKDNERQSIEDRAETDPAETDPATQNDGKPQLSEDTEKINPPTQSDRKRQRSEDLPEINPSLQSERKRQSSQDKKQTNSSAS